MLDGRQRDQVGSRGPREVAGPGPALEMREVRHDEEYRVLAAVSDQYDLRDKGARLDAVLEWRGRDELSAGGLDQLLLAIRDCEESVLQLADVAGVKPAIGVDGCARLVGLVEVAAHDVGTA